MVDLDSLKRDLEAAGWACELTVLHADWSQLVGKRRTTRHGHEYQDMILAESHGSVRVSTHLDSRAFGELIDQVGVNVTDPVIAEALAIIARHVAPAAPSPDRAALVEQMARAIARSVYLTDEPTPHSVTCWTPEARASLAVVEAAGWVPPVEPITEEERHVLSLAASGLGVVDAYQHGDGRELSNNMLAALPERHRRIVLGEGE